VSNACTPDTLSFCNADTDCAAADQQCDTGAHACVARSRVCAPGDACDPQQRLCLHGCSSDGDCTQLEGATGYACRNNACFKLLTCAQDGDCGTGKICAPNPDGSKSCKPGCVQPGDCPLGQGCNNDPQHPRCTGSCGQNSDCPINTVCDQGACKGQLGSCQQACQATVACPVGQSCRSSCCVATSVAQLCPPGCTASCGTDCIAFAPASCTQQADCDRSFPGTHCLAQAGGGYACSGALTLKACSGDLDCPYKGFRCQQPLACPGVSLCLPVEAAAQRICFAQ
jgi:hypothetical protein